jgi:hypothetical protein
MKKLRIPVLLLAACLAVAIGFPSFNANAQAAIAAPPGNGWVQLTTGLTTTTYVDSTCVDGTTCYYAVAAVDQFGTAVDTTYVTGAIPATGTHTVTLSWTASVTPGVTYSVFQGPPPSLPSGLAAAVK